MKFDPTEAISRMPDLGDTISGKDDPVSEEMETKTVIEKEARFIKSFLKPEASSIDQEFEGKVETPSFETGTDHGDSWNFYNNLTIRDGMKTNENLFRLLQEESKNKIALDLGCGGNQEDAINVAKKLGCAAYLGVDKFNVGGSYTKSSDPDKKDYYKKMRIITKNWDVENDLPSAVIRDEMIDGLKVLKDNSSVLFFNGIEEELFAFMPAEKRTQYFSGVADEVRRVVGKNGYIISTEPQMLVRWGGLKLVRDEEFHTTCNPYSTIGKPELYRIAE